jgi:hypothetical protein
MPIPADRLAKVQNHISIHAGACKACGNPAWATNDEVLVMPNFNVVTKELKIDTFTPFVAGHCTRCGNTVFFPAQAIPGLL